MKLNKYLLTFIIITTAIICIFLAIILFRYLFPYNNRWDCYIYHRRVEISSGNSDILSASSMASTIFEMEFPLPKVEGELNEAVATEGVIEEEIPMPNRTVGDHELNEAIATEYLNEAIATEAEN